MLSENFEKYMIFCKFGEIIIKECVCILVLVVINWHCMFSMILRTQPSSAVYCCKQQNNGEHYILPSDLIDIGVIRKTPSKGNCNWISKLHFCTFLHKITKFLIKTFLEA
jgi:hypothetical protein